jgi:hypothetical protein
MSRRRGLPAGLLAAVVVLAGCGSSSLSDRDLRNDAGVVCKTAGVRLGRVSAPATPSDGLKFLRHGAAALGPELVELRKLAPSGDLAGRYDAATGQFADALTAVRAAITRLQHGGDPVSEFQALERQLAPILARENEDWNSLQISACVNR